MKLFRHMTPARWVIVAAILGLTIIAQTYHATWARLGVALLTVVVLVLNQQRRTAR